MFFRSVKCSWFNLCCDINICLCISLQAWFLVILLVCWCLISFRVTLSFVGRGGLMWQPSMVIFFMNLGLLPLWWWVICYCHVGALFMMFRATFPSCRSSFAAAAVGENSHTCHNTIRELNQIMVIVPLSGIPFKLLGWYLSLLAGFRYWLMGIISVEEGSLSFLCLHHGTHQLPPLFHLTQTNRYINGLATNVTQTVVQIINQVWNDYHTHCWYLPEWTWNWQWVHQL